MDYATKTITTKGKNLLAKAVGMSENTVLDSIIISSDTLQTGTDPTSITLSTFENYMTFPVNNIKNNANTFQPEAVISNSNLTQPYSVNIVAIVGHTNTLSDGDVIAVGIAATNGSFILPAQSSSPYTLYLDMAIAYDNAENVTINVNNAGLVDLAQLSTVSSTANSQAQSLASSLASAVATNQSIATSGVSSNSTLINNVDTADFMQSSISSTTDLNQLVTPGTYWCNYTVPINSPSQFNGTYPRFKIIVTSPSNGIAHQVIYLMDGGGTQGLPSMYVRSTYSGGDWNPWQAMANESDVSSLATTSQSLANSVASSAQSYAQYNVVAVLSNNDDILNLPSDGHFVIAGANPANNPWGKNIWADVYKTGFNIVIRDNTGNEYIRSNYDNIWRKTLNTFDYENLTGSINATTSSLNSNSTVTSEAMGIAISGYSMANQLSGAVSSLNTAIYSMPQEDGAGNIMIGNGEFSLGSIIDPHQDLFKIPFPGMYGSKWGYQSTLINFPGGDGAAVIIAYGSPQAIIKLTVINSWGYEFSSYNINGSFTQWKTTVTP